MFGPSAAPLRLVTNERLSADPTVIDRTYPLEDAVEALGYLATQQARGKVILKVT